MFVEARDPSAVVVRSENIVPRNVIRMAIPAHHARRYSPNGRVDVLDARDGGSSSDYLHDADASRPPVYDHFQGVIW